MFSRSPARERGSRRSRGGLRAEWENVYPSAETVGAAARTRAAAMK